MDSEISSYINKAQLDDDETRLILNPPYKIHSKIAEFISPNPNNIDSIGIPKSQNSFFLYRKNYTAKNKSPRSKKDWKILSKEAGDAWKNEPVEVKSYFKVLAKLALQKHKLTYENLLLKNCIFIPQQPGPQQKQISNNDSAVSPSSYPHFSSFSSTCYTSNNTSPQPVLQQKDNLHDNDCASSSSSSYPYSTFSCTSDNTNLPHFTTQQPELQQKQKDDLNNNNYAISSSSYPYSTFSHTSDDANSPHFMDQLQQKHKDNLSNNDCTVSPSSPHPHSTFSYTSDNTNSPHFMDQLQQQERKDNLNNNDCAISPPSPHPHSTFSYTGDNTTEIQQKLKDNLHNSNCAASSSLHPHSTFSCANDNTNTPQQLKLQQRQNENLYKNDYSCSAFSYKGDSIISLHFVAQQPEIQQKQKDDFHEKNNNDCVVSLFDFDTNADWNTIIDYFRF